MQLQRWRPLPSTHPEYTVLEFSSRREHRVYNWRLAKNGSGRIINGTTRMFWPLTLVALILSVACVQTAGNAVRGASVVLLALLGWTACSQVIYESVIVIPPHGIQLETHRGFPSVPLFASRRFIPSAALQDVIINEALWGWNIRYYMIAVRRVLPASFVLEVAYENILPHQPILIRLYRDIHDVLSFGGKSGL